MIQIERTGSIIVRLTIMMIILCGLIYPAVMTGIAQEAVPNKANGSLIYSNNHQVIGSKLIGQQFTSDAFFHGRVSSIDYNGAGSGSLNLAPSNKDLTNRIEKSVAAWKKENEVVPKEGIPIDAVTNSASGLDPDITPQAAYAQVERVAKAAHVKTNTLKELIKEHTQQGAFGEKRVNVVELNLAVQRER
ncbi:potassium-transporting ATPase subunit KdpC [Priestia megaterium]|uniref:potassium-transporting ATPase subunit KdpC n=1 Tax=Priestia megaterium TaxID=1404 RepID=UPI001F135EB7|nr:potassium-transporting ATPase subunit KdpC [Priestia megaterium]UMZ31150.1 potassium-transporting ATPase subunit KdpC [Priestia megaterium]